MRNEKMIILINVSYLSSYDTFFETSTFDVGVMQMWLILLYV